MSKSKDLFDDSTMSFGEHLECLRGHVIKALLGLVVAVGISLFYGDSIIALIRAPIDKALKKYGMEANVTDDVPVQASKPFWEWLKEQWGFEPEQAASEKPDAPTMSESGVAPLPTGDAKQRTIRVSIMPSDLAAALHQHDPDRYPEPVPAAEEKPFSLRLAAEEFAKLESVYIRQNQPVALAVQEPFMIYMKVSMMSGVVIASPWIAYQLWLFVAAGLYPHERKYVYIFLPMSIVLFAGGVVFAFVAVFPFVLKFLLGFNSLLGVQPQIRLSEWISFAAIMPLMFGISFQLPIAMLFLERISVFQVSTYREKRRIAILVIAFLSMVLTPADPMSMLLMMFPMLLLYELGILMCAFRSTRTPVAPIPA